METVIAIIKDGAEIVELYGTTFDVKGKDILTAFGKSYKVKHPTQPAPAKKAGKGKKVVVKDADLNLEPDFIEIKVK